MVAIDLQLVLDVAVPLLEIFGITVLIVVEDRRVGNLRRSLVGAAASSLLSVGRILTFAASIIVAVIVGIDRISELLVEVCDLGVAVGRLTLQTGQFIVS